MTNSTPPTDARGLSHIAHERRRELRTLSRKLQAAEIKVGQVRGQLDRALYMWHQDGSTITDLSLAAGISRETIYRSIDRYRSELAAGGVDDAAG